MKILLATAAVYLRNKIRQYAARELTEADWKQLLADIYPVVYQARQKANQLARNFYDSERYRQLGSTKDLERARYQPDWFAQDMRPVRDAIKERKATEEAINDATSTALKQIQNGARQTTLRGLRNDEQAIGWARVAGGGSSCAFCSMLISRGPVYGHARKAGLALNDKSASELWKRINDSPDDGLRSKKLQSAYDAFMVRWHPNCDCSVVPIFKEESWAGRDDYLNMDKLWKAATRGYSGKDKMNAFRRALEERQSGNKKRQDEKKPQTANAA